MSSTSARRGALRTVGISLAAILLLAACGGGASSAPTVGPTIAPTTAPTTAPSTAPTQAAATEHVVKTASAGAVGPFLTGEGGKTLYTFTPDSTDSSTCVTDCAVAWPPFTLGAGDTVKGGDGVTGTFKTFARADGAMQVSYNGKPLYYYSGDTAAGQATGEGLNGKWFIAKP